MTERRCLQCGARIHRSRTRGFGEKLVKALTSYRPYRCYECGWRGWLGRDTLGRRRAMQTLIGLLITLLITTLLALYVVQNMRSVE